MKIRSVLVPAVACVFASATAAAAQETAARCAQQDAVGFLGISGVECNCTIGSRDPDQWAFRTEPRITSLELNTRGGRLLKIGDVITHIDGQLITTREGARAMAGIKPGQVVVLTIRRNNQVLKYALTADTACADDARLGMYAPARPPGAAPQPTPTPRPAPSVKATPKVRPAPAKAPTPPVRRAFFGFGLMCKGHCTIRADEDGALHFSQPPEVYSVERGSGADKAGIRRGDVLTHVDGKEITTREAGALIGKAKPGTTLRFTVRRGGSSRTVSLTAAPTGAAPVAGLEESREALERARESLRVLQREQQRETANEYRRKLSELSNELARAESRLRSVLADTSRVCALSTPRPGARTLRYTGVLGDTEIEVHGPNAVWVDETADEVTITTGQTQIKVKKNKR